MEQSSAVSAERSGARCLRIDVEPLVWVFAVCHSAKMVLSPHLAEAKMRREYAHLLPSNDTAAAQRILNVEMVLWEQRTQLVQLPLACASSLLLGAFSDRAGSSARSRLALILLGLLGASLDLSARLCIWSSDLPLWVLLCSAALVGAMGGGNFLFLCAGNARIVDNLGALVGAQLARQLALRLSHSIAFSATLALLLATLPLAVLLMWGADGEPPQERSPLSAFSPSMAAKTVRELPQGIGAILRHGQLPMVLSLAASFLCQSVFSEENELFGVYTRLAPFYWDTPQLALYRTIRPFVQLLGMAFGSVLLSMHIASEWTLLHAGVLSMGAYGICVALATDSSLLFASLAAGSPHGLLNPMAYTLFAQMSPANETGTLFALLLIVERLAVFAQSQGLQTVYRLTLSWFPPFVWYLVSVLALIASILFAMALRAQGNRAQFENSENGETGEGQVE